MSDLPLVPTIDPRWVHPGCADVRDAVHLLLPMEGREGQPIRLDWAGVYWEAAGAELAVPLPELRSITARWDRLVIVGRDRQTDFEPMMTGPELDALATALNAAWKRAVAQHSILWAPSEPTPSEPTSHQDIVVDPRWIPRWAQGRLMDRLHIVFPSPPNGNTYLRLRQTDVAWPEGGRMRVHPLSAVRQVRVRGVAIEIVLEDGTGWSRRADMPPVQREELATAIRAFVRRNRGEDRPPPDALLDLLD